MSARWRTRNPVVLLIAVAIVAAVLPGCVGMGFNYAPSRDTVVIKLDAGGSQVWACTIDGGQDDAGEDMAELANGDLVVVGQNGTSRRTFESPRVVRLSPDGRVIADRTNAGSFDRPRAVVADPDGGFAVLMQGGEVTRFDRTGVARWTSAIAMWDTPSLTRLRDGGYLVGGYTVYRVDAANNTSVPEQTVRPPARTTAGPGGPAASSENAAPRTPGTRTPSATGAGGSLADLTTITIPSYTPSTFVQKAAAARYSPDGKLVWERTYDEGIAAVYAALDDPEGGLLLAGPVPDTSAGRNATLGLVVLHIDGDGAAGFVTALGQVESPRGAVRIRAVPGGTEVFYGTWSSGVQYPESGVASALLDPTGRVIRERALKASRVFNGTGDGGYVSVGVPFARGVESYDSSLSSGTGIHLYTTFHALRFDAGGTLVWNRPLSVGSVNDVRRVIQTADGGFAILATTEKG